MFEEYENTPRINIILRKKGLLPEIKEFQEEVLSPIDGKERLCELLLELSIRIGGKEISYGIEEKLSIKIMEFVGKICFDSIDQEEKRNLLFLFSPECIFGYVFANDLRQEIFELISGLYFRKE